MVDEVRFLQQRIQGVVIAKKGKEGVDNTPIRVTRVFDDGEGNAMLRYYKLDEEKEREVEFVEEDYLLDCPQVGMSQVGNSVIYLRRIPERQWKRGYTENVVRADSISYRESREVGLPTIRLMDKRLINFLYNPKYMSMSDGLVSMREGKMFSFAISRKFAIGMNFKAKFPLVFYKEWTVGWVDEDTIILPPPSHHLFEELSQYTVCRRA